MLVRRNDWLFGALLCVAVGCGGAPPAPSTPADATQDAARAGEPASEDSPGASDSEGKSAPDGAESAPAADPYADMPHPPDTDSGRHQLSADDVKELVKTYRPHMRELCWMPRVNKNPKGPDTVRVAIEVEVTKGGEVKSLRAVGGKEYEGLTSCVEEHVKRWHFPRAAQTSTLMFPILFERGESTLIRVD